MQLLTATLTENPKAITTKYGEKCVADALTETGETVAVWRPANDPILMKFRQGDRVSLARDSKGKISLIDNAPTTSTIAPAPTQTTGINPDTKRAIAAYVEEQTKLFGFCLSQASTIQGIQPEDVRATATTLYIQTIKHFGL